MDFADALILGLIQGIAEWLPISSEAMVTLAGRFFAGLEYREALGAAIWLHSGTMLSALIYFRRDILDILLSIKEGSKDLLLFLLATTLCSAFIALPLMLLAFSIEVPDGPATLAIGLFLLAVAALQRRRTAGAEESLDIWKAAAAGVVQGLAVLPGLSRSGLTVSALLASRFPMKQAFRLSFLMSIPVSFGAQVALPLAREGFQVSAPMVFGAFIAAAVGLATIKALMEYAERVDLSQATLGLGLIVTIVGLAML